MSRIETTFEKLKDLKKKALIPYIMAGDPDLETTESLIMEIERSGADILELGVPFSDPIADGPTIQMASERALKSGTTLRKVMALVKMLRKEGLSIPIIIMTYYNIIFQYGIDKFPAEAVSSGIDGVIIPDLPPEEASEFVGYSKTSGLDTIFLLAPTSNEDRVKKVVSSAGGFVYYVSMTGITGAKLKNLSEVKSKIQEIRQHTGLPVAVGFGISNEAEAKKISGWADGVIVGSALVKIIAAHKGKRPLLSNVGNFIKSMKGAIC
ncbi:MAG: tryptophan synthase subunit alpha [Nitrospirae bacterium]|nr:tryptophan synthase subunit alpha [Nitrospirota bacterium]